MKPIICAVYSGSDQFDPALVRPLLVARGLDPRVHLLRIDFFEGDGCDGSSPRMTTKWIKTAANRYYHFEPQSDCSRNFPL